jgi:hypothetical protein
MIVKHLINYSKAVMSHSRDITVIHTIDKRIFFDIPLNFEKGMLFKNVRIEGGRMVIEAKKGKSSDTNNERLV